VTAVNYVGGAEDLDVATAFNLMGASSGPKTIALDQDHPMSHPRMYDNADPILVRLRTLCLALPESTEVEAWGRPTFRAGKIFVTYGAGVDWPAGMIFKPDPEELLALQNDDRFFIPPYFPTWLCLDLADDPDWDEVGELIDSSYRQVALRRMIRALDAASDGV